MFMGSFAFIVWSAVPFEHNAQIEAQFYVRTGENADYLRYLRFPNLKYFQNTQALETPRHVIYYL